MLFRRFIVYSLAILLAALPALNIADEANAAATSRVAIIQSLSGTVHVKKSGGSKQFRAFARMSLNEGDILTTGSNGKAVLQFANGTSADDKMTVSANTTLTFSKLSDRGGTRTKVSMFNGKAWVDVKSIVNKNDEFTLQTPNAIMGVRGTHLLVHVDPVTGTTRLTVAAGIVETTPSGSNAAIPVKPGDNALVTKDDQDAGEITIAPADLDLLMQQSDSAIVEAIVAAAGDIVKENQEKLDAYFEDDEAPETELERKKSNVESLLGAIVDKAVQSGLITEERVSRLVAEAQAQTGVQVDLSKKDIQLSDQERAMQAAQQQQAAAAAERAAEQKQKREESRSETHDMLRERRQEKREQNESARGAKQAQAEQAYEGQLSDEEKARFQADKQQLEQEQSEDAQSPDSDAPQPGGPPAPGPAPEPKLQDLKLNGSSLSVTDGWSQTSYNFNVDRSTVYAVLSPSMANAGSYDIYINGQRVESGAESEPIHLFAGFENHITIAIKNKSTGAVMNHYDIYIYREVLEPGVVFDRFEMVDEDGHNLREEQWNPNLPYEIRDVKLFALPAYSGMEVEVYLDGVKIVQDEEDNAYLLRLDGTAHTIDIWVDGELHRYQVDRRGQAANRDATLEDLAAYVGWDGPIDLFGWFDQPFDPVQPFYSFSFPPDLNAEMTVIEAYPAQEGASFTVTFDGQEIAYSDLYEGYPILLDSGENIVLITVTAPDGVTQMTYRLIFDNLPLPELPEQINNWSFTTNELEPLHLMAVDYHEFAARVSEDTTSITMQLEFNDERYKFKICTNDFCEYITSSGQTVTVPTADVSFIWMDVYEQEDEDWEYYIDFYYITFIKGNYVKPYIALSGYDTNDDYFSKITIDVGGQTYLATLPRAALGVGENNPVYMMFDVNDYLFAVEQVIYNGEPAEYISWDEFELRFREDLEVHEISVQLVDVLGVAEPQWHTVRVYTGDLSDLQLDREQLAVTINGDVYQSFTEIDDGFHFNLTELLRPQVASLTLVPDEASQGVAFTLYDDSSNPVNVNEFDLPDSYNAFKLLIYREDKWNIMVIIFSLSS